MATYSREAMSAVQESIGAGPAGKVAVVVFSTDSPHASRGDVHAADMARGLRRAGVASRVLHVHLDPRDTAENRRRLGHPLDRVIYERFRWAIYCELWTPELGK